MKAPELTTKHMQIQKSSSQIFTAVVIASIVVSFSIVLLNILWSQSQFNVRVHGEKEVARDQLIVNSANIDDLSSKFAILELGDDLINKQGNKTNSAVILDALPSKYDYPALVTSMHNLARMSGVELQAFSGTDEESTASQAEAEPAPVAIPFGITVNGSFKEVNRFIENLENSIRPMIITAVTLSGGDRAMTATFTGTTYYQPAVDLNINTRTLE